MNSDLLTPHSIEAEEAVLGCILIDPNSVYTVLSFLKPEHFFIERLKVMYKAMITIQSRRLPIDPLTLEQQLESIGRLGDIGGRAYIVALCGKSFVPSHIEGYAKIVEYLADRRALIAAGSEIIRLAHSGDTPIEEVKRQAEQAIYKATHTLDDSHDSTLTEIANTEFDEATDFIRGGGEPERTKSYLRAVDQVLVSFNDGDLITLAGSTGMGKTSYIISILIANAMRGIPVGFFSLEMSRKQITRRILSVLTDIPYKRIEARQFIEGSDEFVRFAEALELIESWTFAIWDKPNITPMQAHAKAQEWKYRHGIELLMIDYVQLLSGGEGYRGGDNRVQEISYITRSLKGTARELEIPIVQAAQISRNVAQRQDKRPTLSDLRESGSIENDSDVVMFIYRPGYYDPDTIHGNKTEINIAKHRNGATATVDVLFRPEKMLFEDAPFIRLPDEQLSI